MIKRTVSLLISSIFLIVFAAVGSSCRGRGSIIKYPPVAYTIPDLEFSRESGLYDEGFKLEIGYSDGVSIDERKAEIRYTLDGSDPDITDLKYDGPIDVYDRTGEYCPCHSGSVTEDPNSAEYDNDRAFIIKAAAFDGFGHRSSVANATYLIDKEEYRNRKIISLTFEYEDLFGDDGIYVNGKEYDDWMSGSGGEEPVPNFLKKGREWERRANLLYIDEGALRGDQDIGLRIFGASSRYYSLKRFSVFCRESYSGSKRLDLGIFDDDHAVHSFLLRGGEADAIRQELSKDRDTAVQEHVPVSVFLNGEFWYDTFACERYDAAYFSEHFGIAEDNTVVIKQGEVAAGDDTDMLLFSGIYDYVSGHDLGNPEYYDEFCRLVDIQSYIDYACANLFCCNLDTDDVKNTIIYRARIPSGDGEQDGRWRWALYDMDWKKDEPEVFGENDFVKVNPFTAEPAAADCSFNDQILFRALRQNGDFRIRFIDTMSEMMETDYSPDRVRIVLNKYGEDMSWWNSFFEKRPAYMRQFLEEEFG